MKGSCPECGCSGSINIFIADAAGKEAAAEITKRIDPKVSRIIWDYLSLFRHPEKSLPWKRARRIAEELILLIGSGWVDFDRKAARQCSPEIWAQAITLMTDRKSAGKLKLPLENHNYLRAVAYGLADAADVKNEKKQIQCERNHSRSNPPDENKMSFAEYKESIRKSGDLEKLGKLDAFEKFIRR